MLIKPRGVLVKINFSFLKVSYKIIRSGFKVYMTDYFLVGYFRKNSYFVNPEEGLRIGIDRYVKDGMKIIQVGGGEWYYIPCDFEKIIKKWIFNNL